MKATEFKQVEKLKATIAEKGPDKVTYRDSLGPAMDITTQEEADEYLRVEVERLMTLGLSEERALEVFKVNIGYWTGYYDSERAKRALELFNTAHPIFGLTRPSSEEAIELGKRLAARHEDRD